MSKNFKINSQSQLLSQWLTLVKGSDGLVNGAVKYSDDSVNGSDSAQLDELT
ncbi:hypothetical protein PanWU01x14_011350, partial [Parasponia andersonii]